MKPESPAEILLRNASRESGICEFWIDFLIQCPQKECEKDHVFRAEAMVVEEEERGFLGIRATYKRGDEQEEEEEDNVGRGRGILVPGRRDISRH